MRVFHKNDNEGFIASNLEESGLPILKGFASKFIFNDKNIEFLYLGKPQIYVFSSIVENLC